MSMVERIRKAANAKGLKIPDVAEAIGIGENSIYRWDKKSPSCQKVLDIADLLKMDITYLLTGEYTSPKLPSKHQKILNRYEKFTPEKQYLVEVMFDAFVADGESEDQKEKFQEGIAESEKTVREKERKENILGLLNNQVNEDTIKKAINISDEEFEIIKQEFHASK